MYTKKVGLVLTVEKVVTIDKEDLNYYLLEIGIKGKPRYHFCKDFDEK